MKIRASIVAAILLAIASLPASAGPLVRVTGRDGATKTVASPPPNAAARITTDAGECIKFLSVFVPSHGGNYVVGLSFIYRDMNHDGAYTPGTDKLDVCVNCLDACGWGP